MSEQQQSVEVVDDFTVGRTGKISIITSKGETYAWYVTASFDDKGQLETVLITCDPSQDRTTAALLTVIAELVNRLLRCGTPWYEIHQMLIGWRFEPYGVLETASRFTVVPSPLHAIVEWIDNEVKQRKEAQDV